MFSLAHLFIRESHGTRPEKKALGQAATGTISSNKTFWDLEEVTAGGKAFSKPGQAAGALVASLPLQRLTGKFYLLISTTCQRAVGTPLP